MKNSMKYKNEVILASFLHDIGKFYLRSGKRTGDIDGVNLKGKHQEVSGYFFDRYIKLFEPFVDTRITRELVVRHHEGHFVMDNPELDAAKAPEEYRKYCKIVSLADTISSKERDDDEDKGIKYQTAALHSAFVRAGAENTAGYQFKEWSADSIMPKDGYTSFTEEDKKDRLNHIENFAVYMNKLCSIKYNTFEEMFNGVYRLFFKYLWCCPSFAEREIRDISLFEHMSTTCALATSIYNEVYSSYSEDFKESSIRKAGEKLNTLHIKLNGFDAIFDTIGERAETKKVSFMSEAENTRDWALELLNNSINKTIQNSSIANCIIKYGYEWYLVASDKEFEAIQDAMIGINTDLLKVSGGRIYVTYTLDRLDSKSILRDVLDNPKHNMLIDYLCTDGNWDISKFTSGELKIPSYKNRINTESKDGRVIKVRAINIRNLIRKEFKKESETGDTKNYCSISRVSTFMRMVNAFFGTYLTEKCNNTVCIPYGLGIVYMACEPKNLRGNIVKILNGSVFITLSTITVRITVVRVNDKIKCIAYSMMKSIEREESLLVSDKKVISYFGEHFTRAEFSKLNEMFKIIEKASQNRDKLSGIEPVSNGLLYKLKGYSDDYNKFLKTGDTSLLILYARFSNLYYKSILRSKVMEDFKIKSEEWFLEHKTNEENTELKVLSACITEVLELKSKGE